MSNKEILIEPLTYCGPGGCPICSTPLIVAERETIILDLDTSGNVLDINSAGVICKGLCPRCGHKLDMMRSNGIYRPYSYARSLFDDVDRMHELEQRKLKDGSYHIEGNPLSV